MFEVIRTNSSNEDFISLVKLLDIDLASRDGDEHAFYAQYNKIDKLSNVIVVFENGIAVACGAIKEYNAESVEIKRMYTRPLARGKGIASLILKELESWAKELNYENCRLETGLRQPEAISLYKKNNYLPIANYGQYIGIENSRCFEKKLI